MTTVVNEFQLQNSRFAECGRKSLDFFRTRLNAAEQFGLKRHLG